MMTRIERNTIPKFLRFCRSWLSLSSGAGGGRETCQCSPAHHHHDDDHDDDDDTSQPVVDSVPTPTHQPHREREHGRAAQSATALLLHREIEAL